MVNVSRDLIVVVYSVEYLEQQHDMRTSGREMPSRESSWDSKAIDSIIDRSPRSTVA